MLTPKHHTHHPPHTRRRPHRISQPLHPSTFFDVLQKSSKLVNGHPRHSFDLAQCTLTKGACTHNHLDSSQVPKVLLHEPCSTEVEGQRVADHELDHAPSLLSILPASFGAGNFPLLPCILRTPPTSQLTYQSQHAASCETHPSFRLLRHRFLCALLRFWRDDAFFLLHSNKSRARNSERRWIVPHSP